MPQVFTPFVLQRQVLHASQIAEVCEPVTTFNGKTPKDKIWTR